MKNLYSSILVIILAVTFSLLLPGGAIAAKKKNQATQVVSVVSNDGNNIVNGSVLNPRHDEVNILLYSFLNVLKKGDISKLSFVLNSAIDSTKSYTVPKDAVSIQRKKINKKYNKYLVVNLFNLKNSAGTSISPSSLPRGNYKLRVFGKDTEIISDLIDYQTPALIVGSVDSESPGLVTVEDKDGNKLSETTVATNSNGVFFTEVRANNITQINKVRKHLKSQGQEIKEEIPTGYIHAVTDKDLFALVALKNDANDNDAKTEKPIEVDEGSTLTAKLSKENKDLASEVAKEQIEVIQSEDKDFENEEPEDISCSIDQFADSCTDANESTFRLIGANFREFLQNSSCNFQEYELIRKIILASPAETNASTGKGYCEYYERDTNENKACETYLAILNDFKSGFVKQLPCPPKTCSEFSNIKPPKCVTNEGFCDVSSSTSDSTDPAQVCRGPGCFQKNTCIHKPMKDLFCARIGTDIDASECTDDISSGLPPLGWTVAVNSLGNQYCVLPSTQLASNKTPTLQEIADECELYTCHKNCTKQFGYNYSPGENFTSGTFTSPQNNDFTNCHINCDVNAGKYYDCSTPESKYFSSKCCPQGISGNNSFYSAKGSITPNLTGCLCESAENFNEKGLVREDAQITCKEKCPEGYEKDLINLTCSPICKEGLVKDQFGNCKKKCPEGQSVGASGKCESTNSCPNYCKNIPMVRKLLASHDLTTIGNSNPTSTFTGLSNSNPATSSFTGLGNSNPSTSTSSIPPECLPCFGDGGNTGRNCGVDQYQDGTGVCRCNSDGSVASSLGPEGCKKQNNQRYCEAGEIPSTSNCSCASPGYTTGPYTPCTCPPGYSIAYSSLGCGSTATTNYCSPAIVPTAANPCTCNPSGGSYFNSNNTCTCPGGSTGTYTKESGCSSYQNTCPSPYIKDPAFPQSCVCSSGTPYELSGTCVAQCPSGLVLTAVPGTAYSSTKQVCKCSDGTYPTSEGKCTSSSTCPPATPIKCSDGTCKVTQAECSTTTCPAAYPIRCADGNTCVTALTFCPSTCPPATPIKCSDGTCKVTQAECSTTTCPVTYPIRCADGNTCVTALTFCPSTCPTATPIKCSDGTCAATQATCPLTCPPATPIKCSDGTCKVTQAECTTTTTCPTATPIKCSDGTCVVSASSCSTSTSVPNTPSTFNTSTSSSNPGIVSLTWTDSSTNEDNYKVYRKNSGSTTWTLVATLGANIVSYTDSGLASGTYEYHVNACNSFGCSIDSSILTVTVTGLNPQTVSFTQAHIQNGNITFTYSKNFSECVHLKDLSDPSKIYHNGVNSFNSFCSGTNGTTNAVTIPAGSFFLSPGTQVKLCKENDSSVCSSPLTVTTNDVITLSSVQRNTSGDLTVTYSKNFSECVGMRQNDRNGLRVTSSNQFCSLSATETVAAASLKSTVTTGSQVVLCHDSTSVCSPPIPITSTPRITLNSATLNSGIITYTFTKDNSDCFKLYNSDGTLLNISSYCHGGASGVSYPTSVFNTNPQAGTQVKICYSSEPTVCSQLVTITGQ